MQSGYNEQNSGSYGDPSSEAINSALSVVCLECTTNMTHTKLPRRLMKFHVQVEGVNIRLCSQIIFWFDPLII